MKKTGRLIRSPAFNSHRFTASPMGFEPTISTVTGWRALRAAPRGRMLNRNVSPAAGRFCRSDGLNVAMRAAAADERSSFLTLGFLQSYRPAERRGFPEQRVTA